MPTTSPACVQIAKQITLLESEMAKLPLSNAPDSGRRAQLATQITALHDQAVKLGCYPPPPPPNAADIIVTATATLWIGSPTLPRLTGTASMAINFDGLNGVFTARVDTATVVVSGVPLPFVAPGKGSYVASTGVLQLTLPFAIGATLASNEVQVDDYAMTTSGSISPPITAGVPRSPVIEGKNVDGGGNFILVGSGNIGGWIAFLGPGGAPSGATELDEYGALLMIEGRLSSVPG
jgi:hypothetical protein